jgi:hypothetical protein
MSFIYSFLDEHMEISAAIVFGLIAIGACVAVAAALAGSL